MIRESKNKPNSGRRPEPRVYPAALRTSKVLEDPATGVAESPLGFGFLITERVFAVAETEVKVILSSKELKRLRKKLANLGPASLREETNIVIDYPIRAFSNSGCLMRLRKTESSTILTFKGRKITGKFKVRDEIEREFLGGAAVQSGLSLQGLEKIWRYDKRRETHRFGRVLVEIDSLPVIGTVVEIEGQTEKDVSQAVGRLGLEGAKKFTGTYYDLAEIEYRKLGMRVQDLAWNKAAKSDREKKGNDLLGLKPAVSFCV